MNLIDRLLDASIRHRMLVVSATLAFTLAGLWAFATLNTDAFPDLTPNQVLVMTTAPGLSPEEVEAQVSYPMERAMLGLPQTTSVRSISKAALSVVTVTFEDDVDLYFARTQVQQRMQDAAMTLPAGAVPQLGPPATAMGEVFQYLVEADSSSMLAGEPDSVRLLALMRAQRYIVDPLLRTVPGVASVRAWGGMQEQYEVLSDPSRLAGYGLTLSDLERGVAENNGNFGAGYVEDRGERFTVRGLGRVRDTADLADLVIATRGTTPVRIRDVARVAIGPEPRFGAVTREGEGEAVSAAVIVLKGANGREVIGRVLRKLEEIRPVLPEGIRIRPFYSQGDVVDRTSRTVFRNLLEGAVLVTLVLVLFLRHARAALLTASVIPLALLGAFLAMKGAGLTANLMSLGALDFGLIVDASVVMVENFVRRTRGLSGRSARLDALRLAAFEVGRPVVFGILIIIAVYVPIFTLEGLEGRMFRPMAFTVCAAVLGSLLLALTYVPAVSAWILTAARADSHGEDDGWFARLRERYERLLARALAAPRKVIGLAVAILALALATVPFLGSEFMPELDEGYLLIETRRIPSTSLAQGIQISTELERTLGSFPEVSSVVTNLGRPHEATETMALNLGDVYIQLRPGLRVNESLVARMDSALQQIPGLGFSFSAPMAMRLEEVISGIRTDLGIRIHGDSLPLLQQVAEEVLSVVVRVPGSEDAAVGVGAGAMRLEVVLDRAAISRYGLTVAAVSEAVETGVAGMTASEMVAGRRRIPIVVRLDAAHRSSPEAIGRLLLHTPSGGTVTLSQVANLRVVEGPESIDHDGGQRFVLVQSNVRGRDLGSFVAEVQRAIRERVTLPSGYYIEYGGQFENQVRSGRRLTVIVPLVLVLIGALLYASFEAVRYALLVMLNVPFALVGGIAALWLRGLNLSLSAAVGFIALFGVAVLNGVVLIDYINQLRASGMALPDAVRQGASVRLRPVLMTALVASVGFIPMAIATSAGAEVQRPLASVVIGGLVSATLLTLLVLPTIYLAMESRVDGAGSRE